MRRFLRYLLITTAAGSLYLSGWFSGKFNYMGKIELNKECTAYVFESNIIGNGIGEPFDVANTIPILPNGSKSIVVLRHDYFNDNDILMHELAHAHQSCEQSGIGIIARYAHSERQRRLIEEEADSIAQQYRDFFESKIREFRGKISK